MSRSNYRWYRWQFNLGTLLVACLFRWMSWDSLADSAAEWPTRILGFLVFGFITAVFVWFLWRNRRPLEFRIGQSENHRQA